MENIKSSKQDIQKLLKESIKATSIAIKKNHIIETLLSIQEIKQGNYKKFSSAEEMFQKFII
jgi:hypothetical protein